MGHLVKTMVFPVVMYGCESWTIKKAEHRRIHAWAVLLEKTLESPLDCKEIHPVHPKFLGVHWKDWCWSWNSNTLATWCEELTHWKRPWCWERLRAGKEGDYRGWDGWMASLTQWTWVWVGSGSWWWTGRPGVLQFMGSQRVGHNWATELNWTESSFRPGPNHREPRALSALPEKWERCWRGRARKEAKFTLTLRRRKSMGFGARQTWVQLLALSLTNCITWGTVS